jgi:hypothetical protein
MDGPAFEKILPHFVQGVQQIFISTFTSSPSAAFVVPEDINCQLPRARAMPTPPEAVKWRWEGEICD